MISEIVESSSSSVSDGEENPIPSLLLEERMMNECVCERERERVCENGKMKNVIVQLLNNG